MSQYCTVGGYIEYNSKDDFEKALNLLTEGGWVIGQNFVSETDDLLSEVPDIENQTITIPIYHYKNLAGILDALFDGGTGNVVWTTTDGDFQGGVINEIGETLYNLEDWARKEMADEFMEFSEEPDYAEWQQEVEQAFFEDFG